MIPAFPTYQGDMFTGAVPYQQQGFGAENFGCQGGCFNGGFAGQGGQNQIGGTQFDNSTSAKGGKSKGKGYEGGKGVGFDGKGGKSTGKGYKGDGKSKSKSFKGKDFGKNFGKGFGKNDSKGCGKGEKGSFGKGFGKAQGPIFYGAWTQTAPERAIALAQRRAKNRDHSAITEAQQNAKHRYEQGLLIQVQGRWIDASDPTKFYVVEGSECTVSGGSNPRDFHNKIGLYQNQLCWNSHKFWHFLNTSCLASDGGQVNRLEWTAARGSPPCQDVVWLRR